MLFRSDRPIRIVVPLPPGTAPDLFARHIGQKLSVRVKQPVVIENRPGANTVIGTGLVAKATPDGHTLLYASMQHVMLKPLLKLNFDPDTDFVPVTTTAATEMTLIAPSSASARHIPMKGSTESVTAVAGAQVDYTLTTITNALPLIQSGRLKPLAVTGTKRHELLRSVPTMREAALPDFVFETWSAMFAPAGVPRDAMTLLNREVGAILVEPDTRDYIVKNGSSPNPRSLAESAEFLRAESKRAAQLVKATGATAQ